ncbi:EpsG family protein [Riemerella anatipestifer]|uniref:EpsG family protein n=1 Tax=Riemerella anatipestifer TaxID=34085 RepID=A0AAP6HGB5_RIEAN|nr:EpsG family protein [Riemerella anatipestifer]MBT0573015.1 EpsG family protein [Riemerella anatipestifer]MCU7573704.1 EpsG family protein [Riemerella anatipestifer]MCU7594864.1 EpsG family protein [Riemerella anatipestifer]MCW0486123.1 EpsG family protein [Riemerella anatipestifer]MCW0489195.1 EpsG family protein [Riemerella anatipestifer]
MKIKGSKGLYYLLFVGSIIFYFIIVGLRGEGMGTDYYQYRGFFYDPNYTEPGYNLLMKGFKLFINDYHAFLAFLALISIYCRYWLFSKISYEMSISFMMMGGFWLLVYDMNGIRQTLSLCFIGIAGYQVLARNFKLFLLFTAIATSIHYSSFVFFISYFVFHRLNLTKGHMMFFVFLMYFLAVLNISGYIFSLFMDSSFGGVFNDKVTIYSRMNEHNANTVFSFNMFHRIFIFLVVFFTVDKIPASNNLKKFLLIMAFLNIFFFLLMSRFELIAVRGSLPYRFFELVYFSYLPFCFRNKHIQFWMTFLLFLYVCFQIFITINVTSEIDNTLVPYKNILF